MGSTKADANKKIEEFEKATGDTDWIHIKKEDLVLSLKSRVYDPDKIDTSVVNLCGPGAFFRCLCLDDPVAFVKIVVDLYRTNEAKLGTRTIKASSSLRSAKPGTDMVGADWIPLASLRDDENTILGYNNAGGTLSGLTMPAAMEKWFKQAGYTGVKNVTNILLTKGIDNLKEAEQLRSQGHRVCLLINAQMMKTEKRAMSSVFPDHWVTLTGAVTVTGENVSLKVHSWGSIYTLPQVGTCSISDMLKNYYGYVSGKPA